MRTRWMTRLSRVSGFAVVVCSIMILLSPFGSSMAQDLANQVSREEIVKITRTYDAFGNVVKTVAEANAYPHIFKHPDEIRSDKGWPEWNTGLCPYCVKTFHRWVTGHCLSCHNKDRTLK